MPELRHGKQPFFSIGVPTFKRHDLLRETLNSVISQGFTDFEIIVGNDYTAEVMTAEMLGISDPRIRFVNHPVNLREVGNMNALLGLAAGRYFTWLFDDDLYEPDFLQTAYDRLAASGFPPALFSSFRMLKVGERFQPRQVAAPATVEFSGRQFLRWYCPSRPKIASTAGLFDTAALREMAGGVEELSPSTIGLYCEYLFLLRCALLGRITFIDAPFYLFRRHAESYSESNLDLENHLVAGRELVRRSAEVLRHPTLAEDFAANLMKICQIHVVTFAYKSARIEFAGGGFWAGTLYRTWSRHWNEFRETQRLYAATGGKAGVASGLRFLGTVLHAQYIILRLLLHFRTTSRGKTAATGWAP